MRNPTGTPRQLDDLVALVATLVVTLRWSIAALVLGTRSRRGQRGAVELTTVLLLAGGIAAATLLVVEILTGKVTDLASGIPTQ
ncbi:hypothetical protein RDV89_17475 [Nocardioides zeae]|uniref:DUF2970 domain-containing protein n=1 Tax=Nocardioides imazamoxiresistens TaxID=3231893 RepID=A0ABU3Q035_9ACTN|nr:hypothetical protein [Nocardioides zeae]MDT9594883.1 hypothetical protein [Nocardioides zeae]